MQDKTENPNPCAERSKEKQREANREPVKHEARVERKKPLSVLHASRWIATCFCASNDGITPSREHEPFRNCRPLTAGPRNVEPPKRRAKIDRSDIWIPPRNQEEDEERPARCWQESGARGSWADGDGSWTRSVQMVGSDPSWPIPCTRFE